MKHLLRSTLTAALLSATSAAFAADDSAISVITLTIPETIEIAQLGDVTLTPTAGNDAVTLEPFCVAGMGFSTFSITFSSNVGDTTDEFLLSNGSDTIAYSVGFENDLDDADYIGATEDVDITGNTRNATACSGTDNAQMRITVANADWENAGVLNSADTYQDTLTVLVASE